MGKLIKRIPGSHLLISSLQGSALRTLVELLSASPAMSRSVLKALPGKLDIKRHSSSILYNPGADPMDIFWSFRAEDRIFLKLVLG